MQATERDKFMKPENNRIGMPLLISSLTYLSLARLTCILFCQSLLKPISLPLPNSC